MQRVGCKMLAALDLEYSFLPVDYLHDMGNSLCVFSPPAYNGGLRFLEYYY